MNSTTALVAAMNVSLSRLTLINWSISINALTNWIGCYMHMPAADWVWRLWSERIGGREHCGDWSAWSVMAKLTMAQCLAPSHDIYRAHPELVLLLRGEEYLRIKRLPNAAADATRFYHEHIQNLYRSGTTGSSFVDTGVLKDIQDWENGSRATPS